MLFDRLSYEANKQEFMFRAPIMGQAKAYVIRIFSASSRPIQPLSAAASDSEVASRHGPLRIRRSYLPRTLRQQVIEEQLIQQLIREASLDIFACEAVFLSNGLNDLVELDQLVLVAFLLQMIQERLPLNFVRVPGGFSIGVTMRDDVLTILSPSEAECSGSGLSTRLDSSMPSTCRGLLARMAAKCL